jgi:hypothetical protein
MGPCRPRPWGESPSLRGVARPSFRASPSAHLVGARERRRVSANNPSGPRFACSMAQVAPPLAGAAPGGCTPAAAPFQGPERRNLGGRRNDRRWRRGARGRRQHHAAPSRQPRIDHRCRPARARHSGRRRVRSPDAPCRDGVPACPRADRRRDRRASDARRARPQHRERLQLDERLHRLRQWKLVRTPEDRPVRILGQPERRLARRDLPRQVPVLARDLA